MRSSIDSGLRRDSVEVRPRACVKGRYERMPYVDYDLNFDLILSAVKVPHQKQVFQAMADETAKMIGIREKLLMSRLTKAAEPALVEGGVCLVEMKISSLTQPFTVLARVPRGVDAGAADGQPTDLFAMFLYPEHGGAAHLQALARWSRLLKDGAFCARIRDAADADEIRIITRAESKNRTTRAA